MYSHEIEKYIKQHNYRLNSPQLEYLMDTRLNPQIERIHYIDYTKEYEIWTKDKFYFKFSAIPYQEYLDSVHKIITEGSNNMTGTHYRLYASLNGEPYNEIVSSPELVHLFIPMDVFILQQEHKHSRYLIIEGGPQGDTPIYLGFGDKVDYLKFKQQHLEVLNEKGKVKRL